MSASSPTDKRSNEKLLHLLTGATSGLLADSIMHPIDTIRVRLQVEKVGQNKYKGGTFSVFRSIVKNEGVSYLYKGLPIVAVATVPAHGLYFFGYEYFKGKIQQHYGDSAGQSSMTHFVAGNIANLMGSIVWVPMDIIKQRLQVQSDTAKSHPNQTFYRGSFHAAKVIFKEEGVRGFFRGFLPTLYIYGPYVGIYFSFYEKAKQIGKRYIDFNNDDNKYISLAFQLTNGFMAGSLAAAITCPLDVVKTRIQVQRLGDERLYTGMLDGFKTILKEEGLSAFVKGMGARVLWLAPGSALTIAAYEQLKSFFGKFI
ncbi:hypothetical protein CYY_009877 [Polysphondylium violaceum]|uniref:Mitochondrial substrate carrier family protein n=1 Tax=Polysphondylium violaceum TaxID=133409 RepID=A0A8J4PSS4_9MYCE|nr:hypothetical protein CYY_009877 [Polysphondylium violaceum]